MNIKYEIAKIERSIQKNNNELINFAVIYIGDKDWREREAEAKRQHLEKHGNLNCLRIVRTMVPPPGPAPSAEALSLVHGGRR